MSWPRPYPNQETQKSAQSNHNHNQNGTTSLVRDRYTRFGQNIETNPDTHTNENIKNENIDNSYLMNHFIHNNDYNDSFIKKMDFKTKKLDDILISPKEHNLNSNWRNINDDGELSGEDQKIKDPSTRFERPTNDTTLSAKSKAERWISTRAQTQKMHERQKKYTENDEQKLCFRNNNIKIIDDNDDEILNENISIKKIDNEIHEEKLNNDNTNYYCSDLWYYKDPSGTKQGPFGKQDMKRWYQEGYFHKTLPISCGNGEFKDLQDWFRQGNFVFLDKIPTIWPDGTNVEIHKDNIIENKTLEHVMEAPIDELIKRDYGTPKTSDDGVKEKEYFTTIHPREKNDEYLNDYEYYLTGNENVKKPSNIKNPTQQLFGAGLGINAVNDDEFEEEEEIYYNNDYGIIQSDPNILDYELPKEIIRSQSEGNNYFETKYPIREAMKQNNDENITKHPRRKPPVRHRVDFEEENINISLSDLYIDNNETKMKKLDTNSVASSTNSNPKKKRSRNRNKRNKNNNSLAWGSKNDIKKQLSLDEIQEYQEKCRLEYLRKQKNEIKPIINNNNNNIWDVNNKNANITNAWSQGYIIPSNIVNNTNPIPVKKVNTWSSKIKSEVPNNNKIVNSNRNGTNVKKVINNKKNKKKTNVNNKNKNKNKKIKETMDANSEWQHFPMEFYYTTVSNELRDWLESEIKKIKPKVDSQSFANVMISMQDDETLRATVYDGLGEDPMTRQFVDSFLIHRKHDRQQQKYKEFSKPKTSGKKKGKAKKGRK